VDHGPLPRGQIAADSIDVQAVRRLDHEALALA